MKKKHIIILSAFVVAIVIALLGGKTVVSTKQMLVKDSLINVRDVTITELDSELTTLEGEIGNLKDEYSELESTSFSMKSQLVMMERNLESAKKELNKTGVEKQQALQKIQKLQKQILDYTGSDAYLQEVIKKKNETIERLKKEKANLELALSKEKKKNQELITEVQTLKNQISTKQDSIILLANELNEIYKDPNFVAKTNRIAQLEKEKQNLSKDINELKGNIDNIKESIPPVYNANAYYYAIIKKQVPGKIIRVKDTIKFYLDEKDDYAKNITDIYFSFEINNEIFFEKAAERNITYTLSGGSLATPLTRKEKYKEGKLSANFILFPNVNLTAGDYKLEVKFDDTNEKVIEDYNFKLF